MTSPPRPPSPPSGPPSGTNFSRRNEMMPDPPSPALTRTTTRSMNTSLLTLNARPQQSHGSHALVAHDVEECVDQLIDHSRRHADVEGTVQMRVKLTILL